MPHGNENADCSWASLPLFLLWMIKDKLDLFDNLCVASVCRDWRSMSLSYPKKQSIGDGMPWIMQVTKSIDSSARDFVSISRKKKFMLDLPEFINSLLLYSKQGWLLMRRKNSLTKKETLPDSLLLINPFTRAKIEMPDVEYTCSDYHGSFSTRNGYPERVILLNGELSSHMTLCMAFPGDLSWTKYSYVELPMQIDGRCGLLTIGEKIYYLNLKESMIVYDIVTQEWKELPGPMNEIGYTYIMEYEEKIIKLLFRSGEHTSHSFYTYNDTYISWERLNIDDVKDTSWYLSMTTSCFSAKNKGLKVFELSPQYGGVLHGYLETYGFDILSHDLVDGGTQTLELPFRIGSSAKWVDIG